MPALQLALDFVTIDDALEMTDACHDYVDFIEAGTLLIKAVGMSLVSKTKNKNQGKPIVVDLKPMDVGKLEMDLAVSAGADIVIIPGIAPSSTLEECIQEADSAGIKIFLDQTGMERLFGEKTTARMNTIGSRWKCIIHDLPGDAIKIAGYEFKSVGLDIVKQLKNRYPKKTIVADLKTISNADLEFSAAFEAGADIASFIAATSDEEIRKAINTASKYGKKTMADLIGIRDHVGENGIIERAKELEKLGADYICYHVPIDDQVLGKEIPPARLRKLSSSIKLPIACAGGIHSGTVSNMVQAGAELIVVGGSITNSPTPRKAAKKIKDLLQ